MGKKNKRKNELFIGKDYMYIEGRSIKHPALIDHYATVKPNKTNDSMIPLIGTDIETNHLTGEMRLLGFTVFNQNQEITEEKLLNLDLEYKYVPIVEDHLVNLAGMIKYACKNGLNFAFWNKLDANEILRLFITHDYSKEKEDMILERFGSVGGEWNKKQEIWEVMPVCFYQTETFTVGIKQAIRSSLNFFYHDHISGKMYTTWAFDVAGLYQGGLEKEAGGRFKWYSKIDDSAHLVDWKRFNSDSYYRKEIVLKSNELDCLGASALGYLVQIQFEEAFDSYPASLISAGSLARSAVTAEIERSLRAKYKEDIDSGELDEKDLMEMKRNDVKSIGIISTLDTWLESGTEEKYVKDFYALASETYSGGQIEALAYGYAKEGWYADIASAYPAIIQNLYDLRGSKLIKGKGKPKRIKNAYILIRGKISVPNDLVSHPITIKHPQAIADTNIRPAGEFWASYTIDEREYNESVGCTFKEETWYAVVTKGEYSVMREVVHNLIDLRKHFKSIGSSTESLIKQIVNSLYGIQFEAVPMHEDIDGKPVKIGYRAGEFWNNLFASYITSRTRIIISSASEAIKRAGGQPILQMTDSILWKGTKDMIPEKLEYQWGESGIKEEKTLGYFETPEKVEDIVCFGTGRYGFEQTSDKGEYATNKRRGLHISGLINTMSLKVQKISVYKLKEEIHTITSVIINDHELDRKYYNFKDHKLKFFIELKLSDNVVIKFMRETFKWKYVLEEMVKQNNVSINVNVRTLASAGLVKSRNDLDAYDLGRVMEEERDVDVLSGQLKRVFPPKIKSPYVLSKEMVSTYMLTMNYNVYVENDYVNGTLPYLRALMEQKTMKYREEKLEESKRKADEKYNAKRDREESNRIRREKYKKLRQAGVDREKARKLQNRSWEDVIKCLKEIMQSGSNNQSNAEA